MVKLWKNFVVFIFLYLYALQLDFTPWSLNTVKNCENRPHIPSCYGDRFIPRRYTNINKNLSLLFGHQRLHSSDKRVDIMEAQETSCYWRQKRYAEALRSVLAIKGQRILSLSDPFFKSTLETYYNLDPGTAVLERAYPNTQEFDWPCNPRKKSMAHPDSTHDLPGFKASFCPNIMSWSKNGSIAASFSKDLVFWVPDTADTLIYKFHECFGIAYNPTCSILAVSCKKANGTTALQLWSCCAQDYIFFMNQYPTSEPSNQIICLDWDPNGNFIACGTISGSVLVFEGHHLRRFRVFKDATERIYSVKFSSNSNYLAANDINGNTFVWKWNTDDLHCKLKSKKMFNSNMDWHPWNGTDLVIARSTPAEIAVFHVPTKSIVAYYKRRDLILYIENILFSRISGELLVSCTIEAPFGKRYEILVLASLDQIVDVMKNHEDSVRFMTWHPSGLQLATASDDDVLFVWNFFALKDSQEIFRRKTPKPSVTKRAPSNLVLTKYIR